MPHRWVYQKAKLFNGRMLLLLAIATGLLLVGTFALRAYLTDKTDVELCDTIAALIARGHPSNLKPGDYGYSYAQAHQDEWPKKLPPAQALEKAKEQLGCSNLPSAVR
jgi:hypothetical protein